LGRWEGGRGHASSPGILPQAPHACWAQQLSSSARWGIPCHAPSSRPVPLELPNQLPLIYLTLVSHSPSEQKKCA